MRVTYRLKIINLLIIYNYILLYIIILFIVINEKTEEKNVGAENMD